MINTNIPSSFAVKGEDTPEFFRFLAWYNRNIMNDGFSKMIYQYGVRYGLKNGVPDHWLQSETVFVPTYTPTEFMKLVEGGEEEERVEKGYASSGQQEMTVDEIISRFDFTEKEEIEIRNLVKPQVYMPSIAEGVAALARAAGYIKLKEHERVVEQKLLDDMEEDLENARIKIKAYELAMAEIKRTYVSLEPNQSVITWKNCGENDPDTHGYFLVKTKGGWYREAKFTGTWHSDDEYNQPVCWIKFLGLHIYQPKPEEPIDYSKCEFEAKLHPNDSDLNWVRTTKSGMMDISNEGIEKGLKEGWLRVKAKPHPVKRRGWVNVLSNGTAGASVFGVYSSEEDARNANTARSIIDTIEIEWTEQPTA